jgi:hypothetical protein
LLGFETPGPCAARKRSDCRHVQTRTIGHPIAFTHKEFNMTRSLRWQLTAIAAAAAGAICVAQAQSADPALQAPPAADATMAAPAVTTEAAPSETDVQATLQSEADARRAEGTAATEPAGAEAAAPKRATVYSAGAPMTAQAEQPTTIVVVPTQVDQSAVQAKAWAALEAEPITREEVAAEAAYANKNGLIARGEWSIAGEDKGTAYVEQADQARHARSTQQYLAKLDTKHQQFFAVEQERLNQLALAEQQRQQALAAEQAAQQQQLAAQQPLQPTQ